MQNLIDAHTHSVLSGHAYSTILENVQEAKRKGLKYYGISEHAPAMPGTFHMFGVHNLRVLPREIDGVIILKGIEANILDCDGHLDLEDNDTKSLDYMIASIHRPCYKSLSSVENNTKAYLNVMKINKVRILGHIDDERYKSDYYKVIQGCVDNHVLIEINNCSLGPNAYRVNAKNNVHEILNICKELRCPVILNSDAHFALDVGNITYSLQGLKDADFPMELVVNFNDNLINEYFINPLVK